MRRERLFRPPHTKMTFSIKDFLVNLHFSVKLVKFTEYILNNNNKRYVVDFFCH